MMKAANQSFLMALTVAASFTVSAAKAQTGQADAVSRGHYIATAADCVACHTNPNGGKPFAGGYGLKTPFGLLVASNITPDQETGIGTWTETEFARALREGIGKEGEHLYPAMPYPSYTKMSDSDVHDLWMYLKSIQPVQNKVVSNQLPFPFNIRMSLIVWNLWNFKDGRFQPQADKSAAWNRGAYLVEALEHCSACHTPKNFLGGDQASKAFEGTSLQGWYAPNITSSHSDGIGNWSKSDIVTYLHTGSVGGTIASGPMAEAVVNSTQFLTDTDLTAISDYVGSLKGQETPAKTPVPASDSQMVRGKRVFEIQCAACHISSGKGIDDMIAGFHSNLTVRAPVTDTLIRTVLSGTRGAITKVNPTGASMPGFAWNMDDAQIAAVLTYIRNSWGNAGSAVTDADVAKIRSQITIHRVGPVPDDWSQPQKP